MTDFAPAPYDAPSVSAEFLQGNVRAGLEQLRLRLLDLTLRNRLLKFGYPTRPSKNLLRVVDELPDQLFRRLTDGDEMLFAPVPEPPLPPPSAHSADDSDEPGEDASGKAVRAPRRPPVADYAKSLGIAISFDLASTEDLGSDATKRRYTDKEIQTLQYPKELEAILRKIGSLARLAIEETGTNMLYLAFGFLEWNEQDGSEGRLAPLVLLPVLLRRGDPDPRTRMFRYYVGYSGEDIADNVSLREKLRRDFNIALPDFEPDDTPESYFGKLAPILQLKPEWKLRRQITLAMLSFGKLLMFRDLDPENWPKGRGPAEHSRICDLFNGIQHDELVHAPDYDIDHPDLERMVPPVIYDADSSQHSALVDALEKGNLVIKGPPGTGKSQTITNLIAAVLARGETVLFVSEKLAALEVVRRRLDRAGLGAFCLELHSHKTQKRHLLDDIDARIRMRKSFPDPASLVSSTFRLKELRQRLTEHVNLVNSRFGQLDTFDTIYKIIWRCQRLKQSSGLETQPLEKLLLPGVAEHTEAEAEMAREAVRAYSEHVESVLGELPTLAAHIWYPVENSALSFLEGEGVVARLGDIAGLCKSIDKLVDDLKTSCSATVEPTIDGAIVFAEKIGRLPESAEGVSTTLLPRLSDPLVRQRLETFGTQLRTFADLRSALVRDFGSIPECTDEQRHLATRAAEMLRQSFPVPKTVGDSTAAVQQVEEFAATARNVQRPFSETSLALGITLPYTAEAASLLSKAVGLVRSAPLVELHLRHRALEREGAASKLAALGSSAAVLRELRASLDRAFHLNLIPKIDELRQHIVAVSNAGFFRFLDRGYKAARRAHAAMRRDGAKAGKEVILRDLQEVLGYLEQIERFEQGTAFREFAGPHADGIDSPFNGLGAVAEWREQMLRTVGYMGQAGMDTASALWAAPRERLQAVYEREGDRQELSRGFEAVVSGATTTGKNTAEEGQTQQRDTLKWVEDLDRKAAGAHEAFAVLKASGVLPATEVETIPALMDSLGRFLTMGTELGADLELKDALGPDFAGGDTQFDVVVRTITFRDDVCSAELSLANTEWLLAFEVHDRLRELSSKADQLRRWCDELSSHLSEFALATALDESSWYEAAPPQATSFAAIHCRAHATIAAKGSFPAWLDYLRARRRLRDLGLGTLTEFAENRRIASKQLPIAFEYVLFNSLVHAVFSTHPSLAEFSGLNHEQIRRKFIELDREIANLHCKQVAHKIDSRDVPNGKSYGSASSFTDLSLLQREIAKQKRHIPIRQLVRRAGNALQALKPCFMMGPLSVATYLAAGELEFDYIVIDEASQLKPEDALGAVARGKKLVVVGDPMQLPPTSFFDRIGGDDEEEEQEETQNVIGAESILDVASMVYFPSRLLRWHYRSRHGSLIAFSNKQFYKNELVVFPSPIAVSPDLGVRFEFVQGGTFDAGQNLIEARTVVEAALAFMRSHPRESLGVVTMNSQQCALVQEIFEQRLKDDAYAQRYIATMGEGPEPFFVKNLENVQGDERDAIFISVTYGPSTNSTVYQRFGPINQGAGHRRLNVLFTRAKNRVVVFSSLHSSDIAATPTSSQGVQAFKEYLHYAETGILDQARFTGRPPDSDFEVEVAQALKAKGFNVEAQIGVAGYFIDLAVKHPEKQDAYILAVECDGATYHSSRSARDRDRLRQAVLESLGWTVHRIWSTDWFKDPERETTRVVQRVQEALELERLLEEERQDKESAELSDWPEEGAVIVDDNSPGPTIQSAQASLFKDDDEALERIVESLRRNGAPMGKSEILAASSIDPHLWQGLIQTLVRSGRVVLQGAKRGARYSLPEAGGQ